MIDVLVVEPQRELREGLAATLVEDPDLHVVATAGSGGTVRRLAPSVSWDVALVAHDLPDTTGPGLCTQLIRRRPTIRVLVLLPAMRQAGTFTALAAGAAGVAVKNSEPGAIRQAVRIVAGGGVYLDPTVARSVVAWALAQRGDARIEAAQQQGSSVTHGAAG